MTVVLTSWDDGAREELRVADLLDRHGLAGTFYVARATNQLSERELRQLAARHEIGSHTAGHTVLGTVGLDGWLRDVSDGRKWLEDVLGTDVPSFAYPRGVWTREAAFELKEIVGSARTTQLGATSARGAGRCALPTTVHAQRFPVRHRASGLRNRWERRRRWAIWDWPAQVDAALDSVSPSSDDEFLHLWGHGWEIEAQDAWSSLDAVLGRLGRAPLAPRTVGAYVRATYGT